MNLITVYITGFLITLGGAIPLGLVNLSVMDIAYREGKAKSMQLAAGAGMVEILYGLAAILAGTVIQKYVDNNVIIRYAVIILLGAAGVFFILKGKEHKKERKIKVPYFLRGAVLNLISIQVLLYWIVAVAALQPYIAFPALSPEILLFITGIFTGKILVLYVYALSGEKLLDKWQLIALNINRIIGTILLIAMIFQIVKT
ncbi:MAG: LysE family transporter [Bacteroidales bacterium]|nr:LysE family transporter [Bacteroidales bacterium]